MVAAIDWCSHTTHDWRGGGSGGAMVLGKIPVPGRPTIWIIVGQRPIALAVGAGGGCLDIFTLIYPFSPLSPSLWETARYRLRYCLKRPLNPKQPTTHDWIWLVSCFRCNGPLRQYFSLYRAVSQRVRKKREKIDERKKCPNNPHPHLLQVQ